MEGNKKGTRTQIIWVGYIVWFLSVGMFNLSDGWASFIVACLFGLVGASLLLYGCYLWTKLKNRHRAFMLWGLVAPIGLLGISLLKDKRVTVTRDTIYLGE